MKRVNDTIIFAVIVALIFGAVIVINSLVSNIGTSLNELNKTDNNLPTVTKVVLEPEADENENIIAKFSWKPVKGITGYSIKVFRRTISYRDSDEGKVIHSDCIIDREITDNFVISNDWNDRGDDYNYVFDVEIMTYKKDNDGIKYGKKKVIKNLEMLFG